MDKVKILQFGDVHFDTPFRELSINDAEKRKEDIRETFGRIIELAKEEGVKLILLTGDLFDSKSVSKATLDYMIKMFESISHIRVFISPGNHDPINERSFYRIIKWPSNVHIFESEMDKIVIKELNTVVYGIGFGKSHVEGSLINSFEVEDKSFINLMVMHADVNGGEKSLYNSISEAEIAESGLDYLALGHKHSYSGIIKNAKTHWAYAGNPEGRGFDETGSKGVIIGEVGKGFVNLKFRETCKRRYLVETVDITGVLNYEGIIVKINEKLGVHNLDGELQAKIDFNKNSLFKFILSGRIDKDFYINTSVIYEKIRKNFFYVKIVNNCQVDLDFYEDDNEFSISSVFIRKMKDRISSSENTENAYILQDALDIGLKCLLSEEVIIDDY